MYHIVRCLLCCFFFFNDTATTEIYALSLHDALPIFDELGQVAGDVRDLLEVVQQEQRPVVAHGGGDRVGRLLPGLAPRRSEEHTSELQSRQYLVCRLLLEKKKNQTNEHVTHCFRHTA